MNGDEVENLLRDMQEYRELTNRVNTIFGGAMTLKDVVDSIERVSKIQKATLLTPESLHAMKLSCGMNTGKSERRKNACGIKISWISFRTRWILTILRCIYAYIIRLMKKEKAMTENEAIKACNTIVFATLSGIPRAPLNMTQNELAEAIRMAVKALEDVRVLQDRFVDVSLRLGEYMAIGTRKNVGQRSRSRYQDIRSIKRSQIVDMEIIMKMLV